MIKRVLIVYKKSAFQAHFKEYRSPVFKKLARFKDELLLHIRRSHVIHYETLKAVRDILGKKGVECELITRGKSFQEERYDLIVSVGGDGTFLDAARFVRKKMLLGVNSDTNHSVGKLCGASRRNFASIFSRIQNSSFTPRKLNRIEISLNGHAAGVLILNDVLVCHTCPAAMSHYILCIDGRQESQRSSGLWIATAAGSTGAAKSAGGKPLSLESKKIRVMPRELFEGHRSRYRFRGGAYPPEKKISVISQMQEGMIYLDGAHTHLAFGYGNRVEIKNSNFPLKAVYF